MWSFTAVAYDAQGDMLLLCNNIRDQAGGVIDTIFHQVTLDGEVMRSVRLSGPQNTLTTGIAVNGDGVLNFGGFSAGELKQWSAEEHLAHSVDIEASELEVTETDNLLTMQNGSVILRPMAYVLNDLGGETLQIMAGSALIDNWPDPE
jgi:hypothetical protein